MSMERRSILRHIRLRDYPSPANYKPPRTGRDKSKIVGPEDRQSHGERLAASLASAVSEAKQSRIQDRSFRGTARGYLLEVQGRPGVPLNIESLQNKRRRIEVRSVKTIATSKSDWVQHAAIFVPTGREEHFSSKFEAYSNLETTKNGGFRYDALVSTIQDIAPLRLMTLWTDRLELLPDPSDETWWEVWIEGISYETLWRVQRIAREHRIELRPDYLRFGDRIVMIARARGEEFLSAPLLLDDIAELRRPAVTSGFIDQLDIELQNELSLDLQYRLVLTSAAPTSVCVLDSGVFREHPLLSPFLNAADCHTIDPMWNQFDDIGHGTAMAGIALLGPLEELLDGDQPVTVTHLLESVKIFPPPTQTNDPRLWGSITADAVSRPEIIHSGRNRVFLMPVTAEPSGVYGEPTLWSAALDALAAGRSIDATEKGLEYLDQRQDGTQRLFILSAGNVPHPDASEDFLNNCDLTPVQDPAHAWNALTVGAYTMKQELADDRYVEFVAVAIPGELSPYSSTSLIFGEKWPTKPDVVFEGGNLAVDHRGFIDTHCPDLSILTTNHELDKGPFTFANATSAASAGVAKMAADLMAEYPEYWPETIRGLIVHSARWTSEMGAKLDLAKGKKLERIRLTRRYGHGVPNLQRARECARNDVTIIAEDVISPFTNGKNDQVHFYSLPWPNGVLESIGDEDASLRITLSYFIDPNPNRRAWEGVYSYASHGLRFESSDPNEPLDRFEKRITQDKWDEGQRKPPTRETDSRGWWFGQTRRTKGSIHSDVWEGSAAELAAMGFVAVYPTSGWWKFSKKIGLQNKRVRYSLIISISTPKVDVDIFSEVEASVEAFNAVKLSRQESVIGENVIWVENRD